MTEIYLMNTAQLSDPEIFSRKLEGVSEFRRKKAMSLKNESDRMLSLGAGLLTAYGLQKLGLDEKGMIYKLNKYGKPYFEDCPDIHFSVAHCREMAVCAFSKSDVGCDIEMIGNPDYNIAEKYFSDCERGYIFGFKTLEERAKAFFRIWTLKESFVKAVGRGLSLSFKTFSIEPDQLKTQMTCRLEKKKYYFEEYILGNYMISCCCEQPGFAEAPELVRID